MPLDPSDLATINDALGNGPQSGESSPNGHNVLGALNVVTRIADDMQQYGLDVSQLPPEKMEEYKEAVQDLRHYREVLAAEFAEEMNNELDGIELSDGTVIPFPE